MGAVVAREGVEPHDSHTDSQSVGYGLTKLNDSGDEGMGRHPFLSWKKNLHSPASAHAVRWGGPFPGDYLNMRKTVYLLAL